jgi:hypothetical protein
LELMTWFLSAQLSGHTRFDTRNKIDVFSLGLLKLVHYTMIVMPTLSTRGFCLLFARVVQTV